jgi:hypothetical protein
MSADRNTKTRLELSHTERQIVVAALAHFGVDIPTWEELCRKIASRIEGEFIVSYERMRILRRSAEPSRFLRPRAPDDEEWV